jgi:hypothetical protein
MTKQNVILLAGACLCLASFAANAQVNIMPMGDSVTARGGSPESSYRFWLFVDLTNAGFQYPSDFQFIGRTTGNGGSSDGPPSNSWPADAYEGGSSPGPDAWTTGTGVQDAPGAASRNPNIVLLDLGANDYNSGWTASSNLLEVQTNLETIIQTFYNNNSSTVILLAVPTPWVITDAPDLAQKKFMTGLGSAVDKAAHDEKKAGVEVVVVNLAGGFNPTPITGDTKDGTHPDVKGEQDIAKKYFNALRPELKKMGVVPLRRSRR